MALSTYSILVENLSENVPPKFIPSRSGGAIAPIRRDYYWIVMAYTSAFFIINHDIGQRKEQLDPYI